MAPGVWTLKKKSIRICFISSNLFLVLLPIDFCLAVQILLCKFFSYLLIFPVGFIVDRSSFKFFGNIYNSPMRWDNNKKNNGLNWVLSIPKSPRCERALCIIYFNNRSIHKFSGVPKLLVFFLRVNFPWIIDLFFIGEKVDLLLCPGQKVIQGLIKPSHQCCVWYRCVIHIKRLRNCLHWKVCWKSEKE